MRTVSSSEELLKSGHFSARANTDLGHIPGRKGLPLIGDAIPFVRDSLSYGRRCYEEFGPVYVNRIGPDYTVNLVHPDAQKMVTLDTEKQFSVSLGYGNTLAEFFPGGLLVRDFSDHRMHRRIMQSAFKNQMLASYMPALHRVAREHVQRWQQAGDIHFVDRVKDCLLQIGSEVFLGLELGDDAERVNQGFIEMVVGASTPLRFRIPGTTFYKAAAAKQFVSDYFRAQIPAKRASQGTDMFAQFCRERDENGEYYSDDDIVHHVNFLLFAAHDTTTSTLTTMLMELLRHPRWLDRCRDELMAIDKDELEFSDLEQLESVTWCFKETLRLYPPVIGMARRTLKPFEFMGHHIPENAMVTVSNLVGHRLPEFYRNPDDFEPDRFGPGREEHKAHPFAWFPFGGGAHKCIGLHFAEMLVKVVLFEMLRDYRFESTAPASRMSYLPFPKPVNHLPVRVSRH